MPQQPANDPNMPVEPTGVMTRERTLMLALLAATVIALYLCYTLVAPFFSAITWAISLAVIGFPLHRWMESRVKNRDLAAGLSVSVVTIALIVPMVFVGRQVVLQATQKYQSVMNGEGTKAKDAEASKAKDDSDKSDQRADKKESSEKDQDSRNADDEADDQARTVTAIADKEVGSKPSEDKKSEDQAGDNAAESVTDSWRATIMRNPRLAPVLEWLETEVNLSEQIANVASYVASRLTSVLTVTIGVVTELVIVLFILFYFFRDWREAIETLRSLVPLSERETTEVFDRVHETIYATLYGTLVLAVLKGALGALMFWILGIPGVFLWGVVMALASIVPILGPFVVWLPASIWLALQGDFVRAGIMFAYGATVLSLIDNVMYPFLVGRSLNIHSLLIFFAMLGGLAVFGASGLVVGPVVLAITDALLEIWKRRTAGGRPAEKPATSLVL